MINKRLQRQIKRVEDAFAKAEDQLNDDEPEKESAELDVEDATAQWGETMATFEIVIKEQEALQNDKDIYDSLCQNEEKKLEMRRRYNKILFSFKNKFKKQEDPKQPSSHSSVPSSAKLEALKIGDFHGDQMDYFRFRDMFKSNVDSRSDLSDIAKLSHLLNYLKGPAKKLVKGYPVIAENYKVVLKQLEEEYGQVTHLRDNLLDKLTDLMVKKQFTSDSAYKEFYLEAVGHARALEAIKYDKTALTSTLTTLLTRKMPSDMQLTWYREEKDKGDIDDLFLFINRELTARARQKRGNGSQEGKVPGDGGRTETARKTDGKGTVSALHAGSKQKWKGKKVEGKLYPCFFCESKEHPSGKCHKKIKERSDILKKIGRCRRCVRKTSSDHEEKNCAVNCKKCEGRHHIYLCDKFEPTPKAPATKAGSGTGDSGYTSTVSISNPNDLILQTALIFVAGPKGTKKIRVLIDGGAHLSYVTDETAEALGLRSTGVEQQRVNVFGGGVEKLTMKKVVVTVKSRDGDVDVVCLQMPKICDPVPAVSLGEWRGRIGEENLILAEGVVKTGRHWNGQIDLLIGTQDLYAIIKDSTVRLSENLVAVDSIFGWLLHGALRGPVSTGSFVLVSNYQKPKLEDVDVLLKRIFDFDSHHPLDQGGNEDPLVSHFKRTVVQLDNGQYQLRLPFKANRPKLPSNFNLAKNYVDKLIAKWRKLDVQVLLKYHGEILSFIDNGYVELVPEEEINMEGEPHYLRHRPEIQPHKNTAIRPVFNASFGRPSLNDCLHTGENHVPLMWDVLQRLRLWKYMVTADIKKAFLQLRLDPRDRDFLRFLWVEDPLAEVLVYRHVRWMVITFGSTASPSQLQATLEHHVSQYAIEYPRTASLLTRDRFVDDLATGADSKQEAMKIAVEAKAILAEAGMNLQRWKSNDQALQRELDELVNKEAPTQKQGAQAPADGEGASKSQIEEDSDQINLFDSSMRVFGSVLIRSQDIFTYETSELVTYCETLKHRTCLRSVLSVCARVYDVMGFISPVVIVARMIMQQIWRLKLHWDQELPRQLKDEFWTWADGLKDLSGIKIPRHLFRGNSRPSNIQLHICCDSSEKAYGANAYARGENEIGEVTITLIASMANVAPSSPPSLPRLELLGAVKAVKLYLAVQKALSPEIEFNEVFFWTDSTIALAWIKGEWYLWKPFVGNRVRFIQENSDPSSWRHIAGKDNPADICSRGATAKQLSDPSHRWWTGSPWWTLPREQWPCSRPTEDSTLLEQVNSEAKKATVALLATAAAAPAPCPLFNAGRFSTLTTVLRYTALIQREWGSWVRRRARKVDEIPHQSLTAIEMNQAREYWFRHLQLTAFSPEISLLQKGKPVSQSSQLAIFRPYIDPKDGLIRLSGRTKLSASLNVTPDVPILPAKLPDRKGIPHMIVLIIRFAHSQVCHSGVGDTLVALRQICWIIRGRQIVKQVLFNCVTCNKVQRKPYEQSMGLLPLNRCSFSSPFTVTGLDIGGPLFAREHKKKEKRGQRTVAKNNGQVPGNGGDSTREEEFKVWFLLLTCAATRSIHLEVLMKIAAPDIIMALDRFVSRRGVPSVVYSDNAKQFQRADKDIATQWRAANEELMRYAASSGISWKYIAEGAPWWGGFWERMVGTTKRLTKKVAGKARLTVKELETTLCKVEAVINARPITFQYDDHREPRPLTPNDLLIGPKRSSLPAPLVERVEETTQMELTQRVRYRNMLQDEFERRWIDEYLQERARQFKKKHHTTPIRLGEVVLIAADNVRRYNWNMGLITKLYPSADGVVRSVELKTATGTLRRPVQRLCALEVTAEDEASLMASQSESVAIETSAEEQETLAEAESASGRQPPNNDTADARESSSAVRVNEQEGWKPPAYVDSVEVTSQVQLNSNSICSLDTAEGKDENLQRLHVDDQIANAQAGSVENSRSKRVRKARRDTNFVYY